MCAGVWDVLLDIGLPEGAPTAAGAVTLHDACGARGDAHTQNAVRALARGLGCEVAEPEYTLDRAPCCGYGGLAATPGRRWRGDMTEFALKDTEGRAAHLLHGLPRPLRPRRGRRARTYWSSCIPPPPGPRRA